MKRCYDGGIEWQDIIYMLQAVPSRTTWRRPLMVRQPYSVAVPSTEKGGFPLLP